MKRLRLAPADLKSWIFLFTRWASILALLLVGTMFFTKMPKHSYSGPNKPLNGEETVIYDQLQRHITTLAGTIGERNLWHFKALKEAENYITETFSSQGYEVEVQTFDSNEKAVSNLSIELLGNSRPEEIVVVGAHYDSVRGSPGANDNGSGVAALLEMARLLEGKELDRTVRLVAFVNEEPPFYYSELMGSHVYATRSKERREKIVAMLSLETIGYYSEEPDSQQYPPPFSLFYPSEGNFIGFVGNLGSRALVRKAIASFRQHTEFPSEGLAAPGWITGIGWSDHWSFWESGFSAIMVTDTALFRYPYYHSREDTPDKIDYQRTARVVNGLTKTVMDLAGIQQ